MISKKHPRTEGGTKNNHRANNGQVFRLLFENHPIPMFVYDLKSLAFLDANDSMLDKFGYSRSELKGLTLKDLIPADDEKSLPEDLKFFTGKRRILHKSGAVCEVQAVSQALDYDGHEAGLILLQGITPADRRQDISESEMRALFAFMRDVVLVIDRDGTYLKIAPTSPELLALPPHELLGKKLKDVFSPEQAEDFLAEVRKVLDTRQPIRMEYMLMIRDLPTWFSASITPMDTNSTLWVARDITERKQADAALRESEERYHTLFERMMDGIYRSTHEGRFVDVNPAMVKMFGYSSREEMLAVDIKNELYFAPEERGSHVLDTGQEETEEYRMRRKDGSEIWVEDHGYYVHDEQGQPRYHEGMLRDITARKQAEASLQRLKKAVDTSTEAIFMTDTEGVFIYVNPGFTTLYGFTAGEVIGSATPRILKSGTYGAEFYADFWRKLKNKQDVKGEFLNKTKDGRLLTIDNSASPVLGDAGNIIGYLAIQHDITERKQAEEALRSAEANFRSIFENATVGIYQSTPDGRLLKVNQVMAQIFGYESPQAMIDATHDIGKQFYVNPSARQEIIRLMKVKGRVQDMTSLNYRKDGSLLYIQESARIVKDTRGNTLYYEGFVTDITGRKRFEESLRESESRFRHMADTTPVMVWMSDADARFNYFNKPWLNFTGRTLKQEIGRGWMEHIHPDDHARCIETYLNAFNERREFKMEYRVRGADGEYCWLLDNGVPRFSTAGEFFGFIGSRIDISDFKQAEYELNRANDSLKAAHRDLEQLLSHEQTLARTDGLTGLYNYRYFFELATREFDASMRYQRPFSIIIFDTDYLKQINDSMGHMAGDKMLVTVAQAASEQVRSVDSFARYGGDEFIIMLPQTNAQMAYVIAERIRASVSSMTIEAGKGPFSITLSVGVAEICMSPADESVEQIVQRADRALYDAKQAGRNCTAVFRPE